MDEDDTNEIAAAIDGLSRAIGHLGNGDAYTGGIGAIEGLAMKLEEIGKDISGAIYNGLTEGLLEIAKAIGEREGE